MRVVHAKDSTVQAINRGDVVTSIVGLHNISGRAVLACPAETDGLAGAEVIAVGVDHIVVDDGKLVAGRDRWVGRKKKVKKNSRRDIVCGRDAVADIARLDGVVASACLSSDDCGKTRKERVA